MISAVLCFIIGAITIYFITKPRVVESATPEGFSLSKFITGVFAFFNPVAWAKTIATFFNIRALLIYAVIGLSVYGYAYYKGAQNKPVSISLGANKECLIELNSKHEALHIDKDGNAHIQDSKGKILRVVTVNDIPALKEALKPYGFALKPFVFGSVDTSVSTIGFTGGVGMSVYRWYKYTLDGLVSLNGVYAGISYQILDNSGVGIAIGKGWAGDNRGMLYYRWNF